MQDEDRKQPGNGRVTPLGWSLPAGIAIVMFAATGLGSPAPDALPPEIERSIEALQATPTTLSPLRPPVSDVSDMQKGCVPEVAAVPLATSVVELDILATCDPGVAVEVTHEGLRIAAILDDTGRAIVTLPTLRKEATFRIAVEGRDPVVTDGTALDFGAYDRTILLAAPDTGFELHAYEGQAVFGEPGHVQPGRPYDPVRALVGAGGFFAKVGTPSLLGTEVAQIYTAPAATDAHLQLEAEVTEANCGRSIRAVTISPATAGAPEITPWEVQMPDCDALGDVILLGDVDR